MFVTISYNQKAIFKLKENPRKALIDLQRQQNVFTSLSKQQQS